MSHLQRELISHTRRVCSLYKRALRNAQAWGQTRHMARLGMVQLRERFDKHRDEKDMRKAKELLYLGEEELFSCLHHCPLKFPTSPGGVAYKRFMDRPDYVLDQWHPIEKAAFPKYFALREKRKLEFVEFWNRNYGGVTMEGDAKKSKAHD